MFSSLLVLMVPACSDSPVSPDAPIASAPFAAFELSGRLVPTVADDDRGDLEATLRETAGVAADLDFVRLTCGNGASQEWGADSFIAERGTNRIDARAVLIFRRSYFCPNSSRPREILVHLTDANGHSIQVTAAPFHPDWPAGG